MAGLRKAKKYDWKDSNMALFGSDVEKGVKKDAAKTEEAWQGCDEFEGLKVWRINQFKVEGVDEEDYGTFFDGDSYIILNAYKEDGSDALNYDAHFWIGKHSTQDEYGTAAYKTVELDTFLDDKAVQHREVQDHESKLFLSYFKKIVIMKGGNRSGFKQVPIEEYKRRLLKVQKDKGVDTVTEICLKREKLNSCDVFILDNGLELIQFNGKDCSPGEKFKGRQIMNEIRDERLCKGEVTCKVLEEEDISENHPFYAYLDGGDDDDDDDDDDDEQQQLEGEGVLSVAVVSDADGSIDLEENEGDLVLRPNDVNLVLCSRALYVWVGNGASPDEKDRGLYYGHKYLKNKSCPWLAITVMREGKESAEFKEDVSLPIAA